MEGRPLEIKTFEARFAYLTNSSDINAALSEAVELGLVSTRQRATCAAKQDVFEKAEEFLGMIVRKLNEDIGNFYTFLKLLKRIGQEKLSQTLEGSRERNASINFNYFLIVVYR